MAHHFCDLCKKLGKKKINLSKSRFVNVPEYEVYRNIEDLRKHQNKEHFACTKSYDICKLAVFESAA